MTPHVQEFIESTIDLIEKQEYHEVFTIWYIYYSYNGNNRIDNENLMELFKIFEKVGIDLYKESEDARKEIIYEHMYEYIEDILDNDPTTNKVTLPMCLNHLESKLGLSPPKMNNILKDVCTKLNQIRNDVYIIPFGIERKQRG